MFPSGTCRRTGATYPEGDRGHTAGSSVAAVGPREGTQSEEIATVDGNPSPAAEPCAVVGARDPALALTPDRWEVPKEGHGGIGESSHLLGSTPGDGRRNRSRKPIFAVPLPNRTPNTVRSTDCSCTCGP